MEPVPKSEQIDEVEAFIADAIEQASKETIPSKTHHSHEKPWANQEYQDLLLEHRKEKERTKWKSLMKEVKKLRTKLKNAYFKTQADDSEQREAEEEFRLMKQHTSLERSNKPLISPSKLEEHFSKHLGPRRYDPQPELERPEDHSYILPPEDLPVIDTSVPDRTEIETGKKSSRMANAEEQIDCTLRISNTRHRKGY